MKYVALLSGGKDSCYNLLHCQKHGHELVAAASLGPKPGSEEIDSYMYQTVGQDAIELVARAIDVPLYRNVIAGQAIHQELSYGERLTKEGVEGDETEDLFQLLANVKFHHHDVQGVSVGAILSGYQRTRVEHVCNRLSLTPLTYLWQRDQSQLLNEMISGGLTAVLIKVAGIGLSTKHLGKSLAEMQGILENLVGKFLTRNMGLMCVAREESMKHSRSTVRCSSKGSCLIR
jgi:diphthine-ammonia ligase